MASIILILNIIPLRINANTDIKCFSVEEGYSFEVESVVSSTWENKANIELKIKNTGDKVIENWHLTFNTQYTIENIWNASILETDNNGTYTIRNNYYNQDVEAYSEVSVGMTLSCSEGTFTDLSNVFLLNTKIREVEKDKYFISYQEYSKWDNGFNGALMLSAVDYIEDWSLQFDSEYVITNISNALLEVRDDSYVISNDGNTQNLSSNILILYIQGIPSENEFELYNIAMKSTGLAYNLTEDTNNNGIVDYKDYINSIEDIDPNTEPTITLVPTITEEPTTEPTIIPVISPEVTTVENLEEEFSDSDRDGLKDYEEVIYGTNKDEPDSDYDGISDSLELQIGFNPIVPDSDNNGILDGDEDFDKDGLSNSQEEEYGTCIFAPDSDYDGIDDCDEIFIYKIDPRNEDSNNDGILDGDALKLGLDPSLLDSDYDGILDIDEKFYQSISFELNNGSELDAIYEVEVCGMFTNLLSSSMVVEDLYGKDKYCSSIDSLIGGLINVETTSDFDKATLVFRYDESSLGETREENLIVLWHDEESGLFIEQKQAVIDLDNDLISVELEHFSTYLVVDKDMWYSNGNFPGIPSMIEDDCYYDFYFLLDFSDMMSSSNKEDAYDLLEEFIVSLRDGDRIIPIFYDAANCYYLGPIMGKNDEEFDDLIEATEYYLKYYHSGEYASISVALNGVNNAVHNNKVDDIGNKKHMFILTGGLPLTSIIDLSDAQSSHLYLSAGDFTASIISMNPGDPEPYSLFDPAYMYSFYSGSDCYYFDQGIDLWGEFSNKYLSVDLLSIDEDGDGIPDSVERGGMICLNKSAVIRTETSSEDLDHDGCPDGYDSDKDGIPDGKEAGKMYIISKDWNQTITISSDGIELVKFIGFIPDGSMYSQFKQFIPLEGRSNFVFAMKSNPTTKYSDDDDFMDSEDARPWTDNPEVVYIFTSPAWYDNSLLRKEFYEKANLKVIFRYFDDCHSFLSCWESIGEPSYFVRTGLYYYTVKSVVICAHGGYGCIELDDNQQQYLCAKGYSSNQYIPVDGLCNKKIKSLNLYACRCGMGDNNLAQQFLSTYDGIEQVIAADSITHYSDNISSNRDILDFYFYTTHLYIISDSEYENLRDNGSYVYLEDYVKDVGLNNKGFLVFKKDSSPIDFYTGESDDVYYCKVFITQDNYDNGVLSGLFEEPSIDELPSNTIRHDPVLG